MLPCWGWLIRNVQNIVLENVNLQYTGEDTRSVFYFDNVYNATFKNVDYMKDSNKELFKLHSTGRIKIINSK